MKKKIKFIGVVAAALLATAPIITSTDLVFADEESTVPTTVKGNSYFTYNGKKLKDKAYVPVGNGVAIKSGQTVGEILKNIQAVVPFHGDYDQTSITSRNINRLYNLLKNTNGVTVSGSGADAVIKFDNDTVFYSNFRLYGAVDEGVYYEISVYIPLTNQSTSTNGPVINFTYTQDGKENTTAYTGQVFQVAKGSEFDPTDFTDSNGNPVKFTATESNSSSKSAEIKVVKNTVDTSKAGNYGTVTLSVTASGETTKISYKVLVQPEGKQRKSFDGAGYAHVYKITGQEVNDMAADNIYQGGVFYVGKDTQIVNGETYTRVSEKSQADANSSSNNNWIKTSDLMSSDVEVFTATIMHKSLVYSEGGGSKVRKIAAFQKRTLQKETVTFNGKKYYKIAGAPDYIKASNVDGTKRTLKRNAYVYATSTRRAKGRQVLKKGTKITTYGGSYKFKNGKKYYRIEGATKTNKRYVKVANFK